MENIPAEFHLLPSFVKHVHIGGLHLYTGRIRPRKDMPKAYYDWRQYTLMSFEAFFTNCQPEWLAIEDPELLRRHREMMQTLEKERSRLD